MKLHEYPLSWYVDKLKRGEPFSSLLYGDGEFYVAMRCRTGDVMQCGELITPALEDEMIASTRVRDPSIIRGTDLNLIRYREYRGGDKASIREIGRQVELFVNHCAIDEFADGVVWEDAVRAGQLGSLLRALHRYNVIVVGNRVLRQATFLQPVHYVTIPAENAAGYLDEIESGAVAAGIITPGPRLFVVCTGLGAIPLIMRLRGRFPDATFLDLGSTFDVFVGLGEQRAWRAELYADPGAWETLVRKNLEGVDTNGYLGDFRPRMRGEE